MALLQRLNPKPSTRMLPVIIGNPPSGTIPPGGIGPKPIGGGPGPAGIPPGPQPVPSPWGVGGIKPGGGGVRPPPFNPGLPPTLAPPGPLPNPIQPVQPPNTRILPPPLMMYPPVGQGWMQRPAGLNTLLNQDYGSTPHTGPRDRPPPGSPPPTPLPTQMPNPPVGSQANLPGTAAAQVQGTAAAQGFNPPRVSQPPLSNPLSNPLSRPRSVADLYNLTTPRRAGGSIRWTY